MSEWHDIETAPKDGTPIILWPSLYRNQRPVIGRWARQVDDLICWDDLENGHHNGFWQPTHWMPLPEPPRNPHADLDPLIPPTAVNYPGNRDGEA